MLDGLNDLQKAAVLTPDGPLLVVAGPGTGKTKTLTHRIAYLIKERSIPHDKILALTFTRKAAHEMRDRLKELIGADAGGVTVDTIHAFCLRILREEARHIGLSPDFSIAWGIPNSSPLPSGDRGRLALSEVEGVREESALLSFDNLLSLTVELFEKHQNILDEYRRLYQHILVDEYQDIDENQSRLISLFVGESGNIFAIGDPDQAIYSFRGANIGNFLLFEKDYTGTRVIKFRHNYRSTPVVVNASSEVIKKNDRRIDKPIEAEKGGDDKVQVYTVPDEEYEGRFIVSEIERHIGAMSHFSLRTMQALHSIYRRGERKFFTDKGYRFSDFAVLFRLNAQIRRVEEAFIDAGIPYQVAGGRRSISRQEIRAALSYLHIVGNPQDDWHLLQVLNIPNRHLGPQAIAEIREKGKILNISIYELISKYRDNLSLNRLQKERLAGFTDMLNRLHHTVKDTGISALVRRVLINTGLEGFYEGEEDFSDLLSMAIQYDDYPQEIALRSFLDDIGLSTDIDYFDERADAVSLMTMHASKGLEFRVVFICGVEGGLIPYTLHTEDMDLEEERRLFYVAMTRAMERLYLLNSRERFLFGERRVLPQSPFVHDIPQNLKETYSIEKFASPKSRSDKMEKQLRLL